MEKKIQITLPENLIEAAQSRMRDYGCTTFEEYVSTLVTNDIPNPKIPEFEEKILEGLKGPFTEVTPQDWEELRREVRERLQSRQSA